MYDFLIFYEVKNRELDSIVLLRNELIRRGYTCEYVSFSEIYDYGIKKKYFGKVKIAIVPSLYNNQEILHIVYRVAGQVRNIVNVRWEQVFNNATEGDKSNYVFPKECARNAIHCCWGIKPRNMLIDCGVDADHTIITGPPQMDILSHEFVEYFYDKQSLFNRYDIHIDRPTVLFISSFVLATYTQREIESYLSAVGDDKREDLYKKLNEDLYSHRTILQWLDTLSKKYDLNIVYRPHPAENISSLIEKYNNNDRFKIIGDLNVKQWIKTCDLVFTWVSTSIIESYFAGIPCAILRPKNIPYEREMSVYNGAHNIADFDELERYTMEVLNDLESSKHCSSINNSSKLSIEVIRQYYDHNFEELSFLKIADLLSSIEDKFDPFDWEKLDVDYKKVRIKYKIEYVVRGIYRKILKILAKNEIRKIKLPKKIEERVKNYIAVEKKERANRVSEKEFEIIERKLMELWNNNHSCSGDSRR